MTGALTILRQRIQPLKHRVNQWLGRDLRFPIEARDPTIRLGSYYGGWVVQPNELNRNSVVYSFGAGEDISFDLAMIERFGMAVHVFDPTPKSIQWVRSQSLPERLVFHGVGLAEYDGIARFSLPFDSHTSYHMTVAQGDGVVECPVKRLTTLMRELDHTHLDVLKMDIEGAEYAVLPDILNAQIPIRQLLVEFHHLPGRWDMLNKSKHAIEQLRAAGYRIFDISHTGMEYCFVKQS